MTVMFVQFRPVINHFTCLGLYLETNFFSDRLTWSDFITPLNV